MSALPSLATAKRLVIKIGSALVVDQTQASLRMSWLTAIAADIAALRARGVEVIVVSSGAIALARRSLGLTRRKLRLEEKQAAAAAGKVPAAATGPAAKAQGSTGAADDKRKPREDT